MQKELIFIHGSGDSAHIWHHQLSYLRQFPSLRAEAINLPGHGLRPDTIPPEVTVTEYAQSIYSAIRNKSHMDQPIIVGHSLGGAIALSLALMYGKELGGLILIGTGARLRVLPTLLEETRLAPTQAQQRLTEMAVLPANRATIAQQIIQEQTASPASSSLLYRDLAACNQFDISTRLYEISLPILLICGAEDQLTPPKYSSYLHQHISASELHIIPDAGHYVMREQTQIVNELLKAWLDKQAR